MKWIEKALLTAQYSGMYLTNITIPVPYKSAGNAIVENPVEFEVYREGEAYRIVPILDEKGLRLANLPKDLRFVYKERKVISLHGEKDGNLHVMQDVYAVLSDLNFKTL